MRHRQRLFRFRVDVEQFVRRCVDTAVEHSLVRFSSVANNRCITIILVFGVYIGKRAREKRRAREKKAARRGDEHTTETNRFFDG